MKISIIRDHGLFKKSEHNLSGPTIDAIYIARSGSLCPELPIAQPDFQNRYPGNYNISTKKVRMNPSAPPLKQESAWFYCIKNSWIFIPPLIFYYIAFKNLTNIPTMDDYDIILDFLNKYTQADWSTRIDMIFRQYGEHRLVPSKLLYIGYYYLTGGVNFKIIGLIGDLQLLFMSFVSIYFIKKYIPQYWRFISFIWMLCIFDLNTYENACMTMNGVGNYGVIMLFFVSLYFYDQGKKYIPLAIFFQTMCILSNANGLAASVFVVIFTFSTRSKAKIISGSATSLIVIGWYLITYHPADLPGKLPFDITRLLIFFIRMSGAPFSFNNSFIIGLFLLAGLIIVFPYKLIRDPKLVPVLCIFLFVASTMGLAAIFRAPYPNAQFQTSRYLIYPQLMIGCLILFIFMKLNTQRSKIIGGSAIGFIMLLTYNWNYQFGKLGFERTKFRAEIIKYWHPHPEECEKICKKSCESGIYCIEDNR